MESKDWAALIVAIAGFLVSSAAIPKSSVRPKVLVVGCGLVVIAIAVAALGGKGGNSTQETSDDRPAPVPTHSLPAATGAPVGSPPSTLESEPSPGGLLINFSVDETYSLGKDKAAACNEPEAHFCLILNRTVSDDSGRVESGCTLSWRLYPDKSSKLIEKGRITSCNSSADSIYIGDGIPIEARAYRLEADVELDDGTTGSATYRFTAID